MSTKLMYRLWEHDRGSGDWAPRNVLANPKCVDAILLRYERREPSMVFEMRPEYVEVDDSPAWFIRGAKR